MRKKILLYPYNKISQGIIKFRDLIYNYEINGVIDFAYSIGSDTGVKEKRTNQYYATAYCSWQRGTNEKMNKKVFT